MDTYSPSKNRLYRFIPAIRENERRYVASFPFRDELISPGELEA
jgi:hypothetical protein